MPRCLIITALLLAACGPEARPQPAPPAIPADLLQPCPGWRGPTPRTDGQFGDAAAAEKRGRERCNSQLAAIAAIVGY
ncbi:hypothetical protein MASR1M32_10810 [Rhodobacter sp.]